MAEKILDNQNFDVADSVATDLIINKLPIGNFPSLGNAHKVYLHNNELYLVPVGDDNSIILKNKNVQDWGAEIPKKNELVAVTTDEGIFLKLGDGITPFDQLKNVNPVNLDGLTGDYSELENKPVINNVTLVGNLTTEDLGIHQVPAGGLKGQFLTKISDTDHDVAWATIDIPEVNVSNLVTKTEVRSIAKLVDYEIYSKPEGTLVNYYDKEIRVMCPDSTDWKHQSVGPTGNPNMYYMEFRAYAPDDAISFKEDDSAIIQDQTMYYFENNSFAGIDQYGRKYSTLWLALAQYDSSTDTWSYFGANSTTEKYIGWDYSVEWYNDKGILIKKDQIRINLANDSCYSVSEPYYLKNYVTTENISEIQTDIAEIKQSIVLGTF